MADIDVNFPAIEQTLNATFYESDGVLQVSEVFDSTVLANIQLTPAATEQEIHIALEEAFGMAGHALASYVERDSDL